MSTTKFYDHDLSRFLEGHRTSDGTLTTMSGMGDIKGKWKISDEEYPAFLDLLHDYLFETRGRCLNLVERPRRSESKPLLIDLDFRYPADTSIRRSFTILNIEQFVHMIVKGLEHFFGIEDYNKLRFFVTLRPSPYTEKGKRKDGVHILCPDIALTNEKQSVLRKWILNQQGIKANFKDTGYINSDEDVYDESMTRTQGWIFYGESKPNIAPYQLEAIFIYKPAADEWIDEDIACYSSRDLMELLSIRYNIIPDTNTLKAGAPSDLFATLLNQGNLPAPAAQTDQLPQATPGAANELIEAANYFSSPTSDNERGMIRRFVLECLKAPWYEDYDKWIRVGWCLHNIDPSEDTFKLWMEFSDKSSKASGNNYTQLHSDWTFGMRKVGDGPRLTERSLRKWARDDNPELYAKIISEDIQEYIRTEVEPTHYHIAKLMRKMYGNNYIASVNPKSTEWFKYDDAINMWKRLNQGIELRSKISNEVAGEFEGARGILRRLIGDMTTKEEHRKWMEDKIKDLLKCETQLYNNGFTEAVMKMASQQFCEEEFMNKLNINPFLFGCCNGVLELRAKEATGKEYVIFRQGRPEDYVSFLAGRNYPETDPIKYIPYDLADPIQAEIGDFFTKIFPNAELRAYTLRLLSSCLEGANREQCYYTLTGGGGNGKSKLVELMRLTLGDYQTSMSTTVLTRKRPDSGAANPEIMVAKSKRFIYMGEPDENEPINASVMKQFSGEDMVEARALYGDQEKFRIMGKIFMMCNKLPPVTSMDEGTWRRIRVIQFESKFLPPDHPELLMGKPNVFPRDPMLDDKLRSWREHFLALLVHIYQTQYIPNGLSPVPEIVLKSSNNYKATFDVFASFESDRIRTPLTFEDHQEFRSNPIDTNRIISIFNAWKREYKFGGLTGREVISRLEAKHGPPEKGRFWTSVMVFDSDDRAVEWDKARAPIA